MKGIVFNPFQDVVTRHHGEDVWDDLVDAADVEGAYTSLGSYADEEMEALVEAASKRLGLPPGEVVRWFGREAMPLLAAQYPGFFEGHVSSRTFVLSVNDIIHVEVRKLYDGAQCPHFDFSDGPAGALVMHYRSGRRLCALAQGFVEGAAAYYDEPVEFTHLSCVHKGDGACVFQVRWPALAAAA
ncbi:MAG: heme NO-binding domain-containing protein [Caulobacteraceae bacterium]